MRKTNVVLLVVAASACGSSKEATKSAPSEPKVNMTVSEKALADPDLVSWLKSQGDAKPRKKIVLPVQVSNTGIGLGPGIVVGATPEIKLSLDDGALGISLWDRFRQECKEKSCVVVVKGYWGDLVPMPVESEHQSFAVLEVVAWLDGESELPKNATIE